jgi:hypothetical protein
MGGFIAQLAKSGAIITRIYLEEVLVPFGHKTSGLRRYIMMKFGKYAAAFAMGILVAALSG